MRKVFVAMILSFMSLCGFAESYVVSFADKNSQELGLKEGMIVDVNIENPSSTSTSISVNNFPIVEFTMYPDRGGMARGGQHGYFSEYKINGKRQVVSRDNKSIVVGQGYYNFKLKKN